MRKSFLTLTIITCVIAGAQASIILSEDFPYPNGNLVGNGTWLAHNGAGTNPVQVSDNKVKIVGASGTWEDVSAPLAGGPYSTSSGVVLYSRYSLIVSNAADLPTRTG